MARTPCRSFYVTSDLSSLLITSLSLSEAPPPGKSSPELCLEKVWFRFFVKGNNEIHLRHLSVSESEPGSVCSRGLLCNKNSQVGEFLQVSWTQALTSEPLSSLSSPAFFPGFSVSISITGFLKYN